MRSRVWASRRWQIAFWAVHVLGACVFVYVWHWHAGSSWAQVVAWWAAYLTGFWAAVLVESRHRMKNVQENQNQDARMETKADSLDSRTASEDTVLSPSVSPDQVTNELESGRWTVHAEDIKTFAVVFPSRELIRAEAIARAAHFGQVEESTGDDYMRHIERVVALVDGDEAKAVAWLHDVWEDTPISGPALAAAGISERVVDAVRLLTRIPAEPYTRYILHIKYAASNPLARIVKLADLRDHLRPNCPERLRPRYEAALSVLTSDGRNQQHCSDAVDPAVPRTVNGPMRDE